MLEAFDRAVDEVTRRDIEAARRPRDVSPAEETARSRRPSVTHGQSSASRPERPTTGAGLCSGSGEAAHNHPDQSLLREGALGARTGRAATTPRTGTSRVFTGSLRGASAVARLFPSWSPRRACSRSRSRSCPTPTTRFRALRLFPSDPDCAREVEGARRWLDAGLGPEGRRLMYAYMLELRAPDAGRQLSGRPGLGAPRHGRDSGPLMVRWGKRELGIGPRQTRCGRGARVAYIRDDRRPAGDGRRYLCGDRFTAADLTFAALSASVLVPPEYGVALRNLRFCRRTLAAKVQSFREHPAGAYALRLFREERLLVLPPSSRGIAVEA